jgi:hypothetical protein
MKKPNYISGMLILFTLVGCKKPADRTCFKGAGDIVSRQLSDVSPLKHLVVSNNIDVILYHDSIDYIELEGGENLLPFVEVTKELDSLKFEDVNKCNVLRNHQNKFILHYHYSHLSSLTLQGYGNITSADTLRNAMNIYSRNSFSKVDLTFDNSAINITMITGGVPIILAGKTDQLYIFTAGESPVDASGLYAKSAHGHSKGVNDFRIRATDFVNVELRGPGNFYVYGNPVEKLYTRTGSGQIIEVL